MISALQLRPTLASSLGRIALLGLLAFWQGEAWSVPISSITRVSTSSSGAEGNGASDSAVLSEDGNQIAFRSDAANLVNADTNQVSDVFYYLLKPGTTSRISENGGTQGNAASGLSSDARPLSISADGAKVCFPSAASNIVSADVNRVTDVFLYDAGAGSLTPVDSDSPTSFGANDGDASACAVSADGTAVAYSTVSTFTLANDSLGFSDILRHALSLFALDLVSFSTAGQDGGNVGNGPSTSPAISADGSITVFSSKASDLVSGDTNGASDIFIYTQGANSNTLGIVTLGGTSAVPIPADGDSEQPAITPDGRYVVFASKATNLVSSDTSGTEDIVLWDRSNSAFELISVGRSGKPANGASVLPSISSDGRYVAFLSNATNLVSGDSNAVRDVFVRDRTAGVTLRVNVSLDGTQASQGASDAQISADGKRLVFSTADSGLVSGDANGVSDVFVVDLNPIVTPDTVFADPPAVTVDQEANSVVVTMPELSGAAPSASSARAARVSAAKTRVRYDFRYQVTLTGQSGDAASDIRRRNTKRNEYSFKRLRSGSYATAFRVGVYKFTKRNGVERRRLVRFTAFSPSNTFSVD